eukprot:6942303-Prymnesium_polylepis.1
MVARRQQQYLTALVKAGSIPVAAPLVLPAAELRRVLSGVAEPELKAANVKPDSMPWLRLRTAGHIIMPFGNLTPDRLKGINDFLQDHFGLGAEEGGEGSEVSEEAAEVADFVRCTGAAASSTRRC